MNDHLIKAVARAILETDPTCDYDACELRDGAFDPSDTRRNWWNALHNQARAAITIVAQFERDACAQIADAHAADMEGFTEEENAAQQIASLIRARGSL